MKIAIIGGGISGLTLAWYLQKAGVAYDLFEADPRAGGNLQSWTTPEGYLLEVGPNSLQLSPEIEELIADLGLTDQIQDAAAVSQQRYVLRDGRYQVLPGSPPALLTNGFFSLKAKWQLLKEFRRPAAAPDANETVAHFFRRRFGSEILDYAVNPFMAGIYAGDPERLLLHKTFPQLAALEQEHGSVLRGLAKKGKGAGRRRIVTLSKGLQTLTDTLAARLTNYQPGTEVKAIFRATDGTYQLELASPQGLAAAPGYTHLAVALPTYALAPLLEPLFPQAAAALAAVHYPPMSAVYSAYDRAAVTHPLNGFGALHPKVEGAYAAGSIWTSAIYPQRVPAGQVLFTTFVGGAQYEAAATEPEEAQKAAVHAELSKFYGITGAPRWQGRYFWPRSIPQFDERIVGAHAAAAALEAENIWSVANWRAGVGVPDCVRHARQVASTLSAEK
ncbi:protoporphyrinogen oxidase [Hymenobacter arizonensis]|uniref:Coproporphyrinogen III oxidase n=1 Tax=Hymenobacter arizonensis TaxID=1227077 RepID=A0A1I5SCI7_HYMAR|nr:protoporphyrinogen oxidase [Hymenobacter arizonensis]SFP68455.1 oxygen-dependent protoporphyrinogen oxidase [Hymenobacter arizonensis]